MLKKVQKLFSQDNRVVILIFILALVLRLLFLGKFPIGMTHDELNYALAAKSLFNVGTFVPQTDPALLPGSLGSNVVIAEVPALILAPFIGLTKLNLFDSRVVGSVFSSLSAVILYLLVLGQTKKRVTATAVGIIYAINPWSFLMGRTVFEVNFFVFFILLGFLVLLKTRGAKIFWSLPIYLLGFLSYTGGQVAFYLFIILTLLFHYFSTGAKKLLPYVIYGLIITLILGGYVFAVSHNQSMATRGGELYLPTNVEIAKQVDAERLVSVPSKFGDLLVNKATIYAKGFIEKYLAAFSVNNLFVNGEFRAAFSYQKHGTFFYVDILFLIIGVAVLFKLDRRFWFFVLAAIAVSPITSGLSTIEYSYSQRAGLMYPFLIVLIGVGVGYCLEAAKRNTKILVGVLIAIIYLVSFANLAHLYFYRFPVYASDGWFFQDRTISRYIELTRQQFPNRKIVVTTFEPKIIFEEYLFYSDSYETKTDIVRLNAKIAKSDYSTGNVLFTAKCLDSKDLTGNVTWIYDPLVGCGGNVDRLRVTRFRDVYEQYLIEKDTLCKGYGLGTYVATQAFKNFDVENQNSLEFCQSWITKIQ